MASYLIYYMKNKNEKVEITVLLFHAYFVAQCHGVRFQWRVCGHYTVQWPAALELPSLVSF